MYTCISLILIAACKPPGQLLPESTADAAFGKCVEWEGEPCELGQDSSLSLLQLQKKMSVPAMDPQVTISCSGLKDAGDLKCNGEDVSLGTVGQGNFNLCEKACEMDPRAGGTTGCCKMNNRNGACSFLPDTGLKNGASLKPANNPTRHAVLCTNSADLVAANLGEDEMVLLGPGYCIDHSSLEELDDKSSALLEEKSEANVKNKVAATITLLKHYRGHALDLSADSCKAKCVETPECSYASFFEGPQPSSPTECKLYGGIPCGLTPSETEQDVVTYGRPSWFFRD